jgi:hypothetical protein
LPKGNGNEKKLRLDHLVKQLTIKPKSGGDFIDNRSLTLTLVILAAQEIFAI